MIKISKCIDQIRRISLKGGRDQTTSHLTYYISVRMSLANHPSSVKEKKILSSGAYQILLLLLSLLLLLLLYIIKKFKSKISITITYL